jgi:MprA protease rhombosortase-interaction domain-containing protein
MTIRWRLPWAAGMLAFLTLGPAGAEDLRVLYAEPLAVSTATAPGAQKITQATPFVFTAYSRRFELVLEDNARLLRAAPRHIQQRLGEMQPLRGTVSNVPDSWVRLTRSATGYSGAFWDGSELYVIAPRQTIESSLLTPLPPSAATSVIYRLSDTQGGPLTKSCALAGDGRPVTPLAGYRGLIRELKAVAAASAADRQIEVSVVGDVEFNARYGGNAANRMVEYMNVVDGIFSSQVGVNILPTDFITFTAEPDPFAAAEAGVLITDFANYRNDTPAVRSRGLAHLFTGRQLLGNTIGVAYLGALCEPREGVGLTEYSSFIESALVTAHEIGHNFGAPHDNEQGSPCASTPFGYIMEPGFNYSSTFSQCSLQQMQPHMAVASCITASPTHDVGIDIPDDVISGIVNQPVDVVADVTASGDVASSNVVVSAQFDSGVSAFSASMPGAQCYGGGSSINCVLPSLSVGETRRMTVRINSSTNALSHAVFTVTSPGDRDPTNNSDTVQIAYSMPHDVRIIASPQPFGATVGEPYDVTYTVTSTGTQNLPGLRVQITNTDIQAQSGQADGGGTCAVNWFMATCELGTLTPGEVRHIVVRSLPVRPGSSSPYVIATQQADASWSRTFHFSGQITSARDAGVSLTPMSPIAAAGADFAFTAQITSYGRYAFDNVQVRLEASDNRVAITVDDGGGATCTSGVQPVCTFASLAPGAVRTIRFHTRSDVILGSQVIVRLLQSDDEPANDWLATHMQVRTATEIMLEQPSYGRFYEGREMIANAGIRSTGALRPTNVVAGVTLSSGLRIVDAQLSGVPCTIRTPANGADCSVAQFNSDFGVIHVRFIAADPGVYTATHTIAAAGDADPSNNTVTSTIEVLPEIDGHLTGPVDRQFVMVGEAKEFTFNVTTNRYALTDAELRFGWSGPVDEVSASWSGGTCTSTGSQLQCLLGTIPGNTSVPVTLRVRANTSSDLFFYANLLSPAEMNSIDNSSHLAVFVYPLADLSVASFGLAPTGIVGTPASFTVTVATTNMNPASFLEVVVDPAQADSVSFPCSNWSSPTRCELGTVNFQGQMLNITVTPRVTGPVPVRVRVGAQNDSNPANNEKVVTIDVLPAGTSNPPPTTPPPSGGGNSGGRGGGGGGAIDPWICAALLLLGLTRRRSLLRAARLPDTGRSHRHA